ncbi:MAG TPA: four helix bundle protein [Bacteroidales bacterium]|nr:four helix bundle protein [Bacteroidales bacterium]
MIEKLQIYKDSYLLAGKLYQAMPQMDKMHRHVIGTKILDCALDLFKWISLANQSREKGERMRYLDSFLSTFEQLRVYLRICNDFKLLKLSTLSDIYLLTTSISKQLSGWRNATTRT